MDAFKLWVLIAAALAFGQATEWPVADRLAIVLLAVLAAAWVWSRLSLRGLSLTRETATDRAQVGQPLREAVEVHNAGRLGKLWLEVVDQSTLPHHSVGRVLHVGGRRAVRWETETRCVRRGRFRIGPLTLRSGDPLGLFPSRLHLPDTHEVIVYPAVLDLRDFPMPTGTLTGGTALERRNPFVTSSVAGVRDYNPGDAFNRISWAATARTGRLMVKEFDLDPTADVWLVLDLEQAVQVPASRPLEFAPDARGEWPLEAWLDATEEYAVTIVASLAHRFLEQGRNVGLIASGAHLEIIPADRSGRQDMKVLEALAVVRADGHLPLAEVLVAEGCRFTRQSSVIVVTPSTDEGWVRALAEIVGRRVRASAILVEPETFGPAPSSLLAVSGLVAAGIPAHLVKYGDDLAAARPEPRWARTVASLAAPAPRLLGRRLAAAARRLTPGEGWAAVLLHAIVVLAAAWTVQRADWAPDRSLLAIVSLGGLGLGLVLGKLRAPDLLAHLLAIWGGVAVVFWLTLDRLGAIPDRRERLRFLWARAQQWYDEILAGGGIDDEGLFVVVMALTIWLVAYTSAWVLYRRGWLTTALVLPGIIAVVNLGYAPEAGTAPLLVYVVAACLLAARHHAYRREREWARARTPRPARLPWRFLGAGANVALLVALLGWNLPLSARATLVDAAWARLEPPVSAIEERWRDWVGDLGGGRRSGGGSYAAFNDSFRLGGRLDLADDPVMVLRGGEERPTYLAGHRYNVYDGHGWRSDAAETFDEIDDDGDRYSSEMTFKAGQPISLSPRVWTRREEVGGSLTVLRPKGDLLFTLGTVQTVDRETHVRLSWRQLRGEPYPIQTNQVQREIPVDLRPLVSFLAEGSFDVPKEGVEVEAPPPTDSVLAARITAERTDLGKRFLKTDWEIGPDGRATTLFVAGQIAIYDDVEAVSAKLPPAVNDTYAVTGLASFADPADLRRAGSAYPDQVRDRYRGLPPTVTEQTRALSERLRGGLDNPFDIAVAVQNYVRGAIAYDEEIDAPPEDRDVVDFVLFESKRGYCEYYASAMAVMLRTLDIPARVVGGYFPATEEAEQGGFLYREKNAHLWVEVYFPGYGWIPFEPTASRDALSYGDRGADAEPTATPAAAPSPPPNPATPEASPAAVAPPAVPPAADASPIARVPGPLGWATLGLGVFLAVAAALATGVWLWGFRGLSPTGGFYARLVRAGRWLGVTPSPAMTPSEYADRLGRVVPTAGRPARLVADLYNSELYAGRPPEPAAGRTARAAWTDLRRALLRARLSRRRAGNGSERG